MAILRVKSGAAGAADGTSWTDAYTTLAAALAAWTSSDWIAVSHQHAESTAGNIVLTALGTAATPTVIICCDDGSDPPTARATTATITTTASGSIQLNGFAYYYGIQFLGTYGGTNSGGIAIGTATNPAWLRFENCIIECNGASGSHRINIGAAGANADDQLIEFINTNVKFSNATNEIIVRSQFKWFGGEIDQSGPIPSQLFEVTGSGQGCVAEIAGVDLSYCNTALVAVSGGTWGLYTFRNCKLHASVTPLLSTSPGQGGAVVKLINCDSGDTNYRDYQGEYAGEWQTETTIKRTGGASDGTTGRSFKFVSSADSKWYAPLYGPWMTFWNETVGSVTVAAEVVTDNVTLTDLEAWIEVEHLGTSGFPQSIFESDRLADPIFGTPANQSSSSETWTTTGLSTPVKQTLSKAVTVAEKGPIRARVVLAKPSTTMYADASVLASSGRQWMGAEYVNEGAGGSADYPSEDDVRDGVTFDSGGQTGNLVLPTETNVLLGVGFGTNGTQLEGLLTLPSENDVQNGVNFGPGLANTGNLVLPTEAQVEDGVGFGSSATEFEGELVAGSGGSRIQGILSGGRM